MEASPIPISSSQERSVGVFCFSLAAIWIAVFFPLITKLVDVAEVRPYSLGYKEGLFYLQLLSYSFVHIHPLQLAGDLVYLLALSGLMRRHLSLAGVIRLYSLGTLGGGLAMVLLYRVFDDKLGDYGITGGHYGMLALMGCLGIMIPTAKLIEPWLNIQLFGGKFMLGKVIAVLWVGAIAIQFEYRAEGKFLLYQVLVCGVEFVQLAILCRAPLVWAPAVFVLGGVLHNGLVWGVFSSKPQFPFWLVVLIATGGLGMLYAVIEQRWRRLQSVKA